MIFKKSEIEVLCGYPRPDFRRESALLNQDWFRFSFGRVGDAETFMERFFAGETFSDRERPLETEMPFVLPAAEAAPFTVFVKRFSVKTNRLYGFADLLRNLVRKRPVFRKRTPRCRFGFRARNGERRNQSRSASRFRFVGGRLHRTAGRLRLCRVRTAVLDGILRQRFSQPFCSPL